MLQRRLTALVIGLILLSTFLVPHARAETVSVVVSQDSVLVQMSIHLEENFTDLPLINAQIGTSNSTTLQQQFSQPINAAIQKLVAGASLSSLSLTVRTSNSTGIWILDENYTMSVTGANSNSGSSISSNLGFIPMNVSGSLQYGGLQLDSIGPATLLPALQAKASAYSSLVYFIDGSNPSTSFIPEQTTRLFSLLDFTWFAPVSTWTVNQNYLGQNSRWAFDPTSPRYNLTVGVPSPEGPLLRDWIAIYNPSVSVTVPANAYAKGNTIYFDTPTASEAIMPILVLASLIIAIAGIIIDRRLTGSVRVRKKR